VPDPNAALVRDKLEASDADGLRLLAALALFGDATVGKEHLREIAGAKDFDGALMAALLRRDLWAHSPRYNLGVTLGAAAGWTGSEARAEPNTPQGPSVAKLDLAPVGARALAYFTGWARQNRDQPAVVLSEAGALIALLRWAVETGRTREAIKLGRAVDPAFPLERRFGTWGQVLTLVHAAALTAADRDAEAWALHQLGTRALCLGDLVAGNALLGQALELRRRLGDEEGASYTARNMSMASRPRWYTRWILGHSMLMIGLVVALFAAGVVAAATLRGGGHSQGPTIPPPGSTTSSTPTSSSSSTTTQSSSTSTSSSTTTPAMPKLVISLTGSGRGQVTLTPGGKICSQSCTLSFERNADVTVTATPSETSVFAGFTNCTTTTSSCSVTMTGDKTVGAEFEPAAILSVRPGSDLSVTSAPAGINCPTGCQATFPLHAVVTLSANADAYWTVPGCPRPPAPSSTFLPAASGSTTCSIKLDLPQQNVALERAPPPRSSTSTTSTTSTTSSTSTSTTSSTPTTLTAPG